MAKAITKSHLTQQYQKIHELDAGYNVSGMFHWAYLSPVLDMLKPSKILDYGCGQSASYKALTAMGYKVSRYDPSILEISQKPEGRFDCLINTDVLEHIPEDILDNVIQDLAETADVSFIAIHTAKAKTILPDGTNAHCTIRPGRWWEARLKQHFSYVYRLSHVSPVHCLFIASQKNILGAGELQDWARTYTTRCRQRIWLVCVQKTINVLYKIPVLGKLLKYLKTFIKSKYMETL